MTTTASGRRQTTACNGVTTPFPVNFQFEANGELFVYLGNSAAFDPGTDALLTEGVDYTITGSGPAKTAVVTTTIAYPTGKYLTRYRVTSRAQSADFVMGDGVGAEKLETALDRLALIEEEQDEGISDLGGRALQVPRGESAAVLPAAASRADTVLGFDLSGVRRLFTSTALAGWLLSALTAALPANLKGDPGGNAMAVGAFTALASLSIPVGTDLICTTEYRAGSKKGRAFYRATPQANTAADIAYAAAHPGWTVRTANGRLFSLDEEQDLLFEMFGAYGDSDRVAGGGTDDYAQWLYAYDYIQTAKRTHGNAYYKSVPELNFGRYDYRFSHYLDLVEGVYKLRGAGPNALDRGGNTAFVFDAGQCGIILQSWATAGVSGTTSNTPKGASYSLIEDIDLFSLGGTVGADQHGILAKCPATLNRVGAYNFGGNGFFIAADVTHGGNANCGKMYGCKTMYNGRAGLRTEGGDANAWEIVGFNAINNGTWGICELSFLGNHVFGYHTAGNAGPTSGPSWAASRPGTLVHQTGHYYRVIPGQEAGASTNAPTGAATSNTWWSYYGDGGVTSQFPQWVSGTTYVQGGAVFVGGASNRSGITPGYMESDQAIGWTEANRARISGGGFCSFMGPSAGTFDFAWDGRVVLSKIGTSTNNGDGIEINATQVMIGPNCYLERVGTESVNLRGPLGGSLSFTRNDSGHQHPYSVSLPAGLILADTSAGYLGAADAMPSTGSYTRGAFVHNRLPSIAAGKVLLGWKRLTTGSAHVAGTDWTTIFGTTT